MDEKQQIGVPNPVERVFRDLVYGAIEQATEKGITYAQVVGVLTLITYEMNREAFGDDTPRD